MLSGTLGREGRLSREIRRCLSPVFPRPSDAARQAAPSRITADRHSPPQRPCAGSSSISFGRARSVRSSPRRHSRYSSRAPSAGVRALIPRRRPRFGGIAEIQIGEFELACRAEYHDLSAVQHQGSAVEALISNREAYLSGVGNR